MIAVSLRLLSHNDTPHWELDKSSWMWSALLDQFVKSIKIDKIFFRKLDKCLRVMVMYNYEEKNETTRQGKRGYP